MSFSTPLKSGKAKTIAMTIFMPLKPQRTLVDITEDPTQEINIIEHPRFGDWWGAPNTDGDVSSRYQIEYFLTLPVGQKPEEVHVGYNSKARSVVSACQRYQAVGLAAPPARTPRP